MNSPGARGGGTQISQVSAQPGVPSLPSPDRSRLDAAPFSPPIAGRSPTATHNPTQLPHELGAHEGEAGVGGGRGGHSIALPTRFTAARAKSQRTKRGEAAGRGLGAARGEGRQRDPHPRAPQPHAATPTPPLQPRTRGMDPLHGAVGGGGRHAAFGVILSFPPRHLPPRPSPARDAPDFSSS